MPDPHPGGSGEHALWFVRTPQPVVNGLSYQVFQVLNIMWLLSSFYALQFVAV